MTILKLNVMNLTIESCIQHINITVLGYKYRIRPVCGAEDEKWGVVGNRFGLGGDIQLGQPARSRRSQLQSQRIRLFRYRIDFRFVVARFRFSAPAFFEQHWTQIQPHYNCCDGDYTIRYIRYAISTCSRKLIWVSLICRTEPTTKKWKTEKLKSKKTDMLRSIGKESEESAQSVLEKKMKAVRRICRKKGFKPGMKEWKVIEY